MDRIVGIDLGTSTSCLAVVRNGEPFVVPDGRGNRVTPSYIHVMEDGKILVGPQAKMEVISDPYSTIWATKRLIGRRYDEPEVQACRKYFGYDILRAADGGIKVRGRDKELTPTEVSAIILKYLTRLGKKVLGEDIKRAVITVPAYFTDPQRKATREAGTMIGLDVVRLVNEPTAAALAYGYDQDMEQTVAIFDLGGGTFDLSILAIGQGVFEVMATDGDSFLGGEDFDNRLVEFLAKDFKKKFDINIFNDKMAHQRVKDAAERTKIALSEKEEVEINLPAICPDVNRWAGIETLIARKQYENMVDDLVSKTTTIFRRLLKEVGLTPRDLDNVILVGGMTRMPIVRRKVTDFLGYDPDTSLNPDEAVGIGAAIHAASLSGEKLLKKRKAAAAPVKAPAAPPPQEATRPGIPPSPALDQDRTRPGFVVPGAVAEKPPAPPEFAPPPPPPPLPPAAVPPSRARVSTPDYYAEPLPMEKSDTDLPIEPARLQETQPPEPAPPDGPGQEWSEEAEPEISSPYPVAGQPTRQSALATERSQVVEPEEIAEPEIEEPTPPPAVETPAPNLVAPSQADLSGEDDFFMPPSAKSAEAFAPPPLPAPVQESAQETTEEMAAPPPEEVVAAEPVPESVVDEDRTPAPPEFLLPLDPDQLLPPAPAPFADEEPIAMTPEEETEEPPAPPEPAAPTGPPEDEQPVAAGPIIRDYDVATPGVSEVGGPDFTRASRANKFAPTDTGANEFAPTDYGAGDLSRELSPEPVPIKAPAPEFVAAPVLLDVLGQSVGIAHFGGHFIAIIKRFAKLPARASQVFTTAKDNQKRIRISVLQGESKYVKGNTPLGEFVLDGIETARRGVPEIEVSFDIDPSGIFVISAKDKHTGAAREIKLSNWTGGVASGSEQKSGASEA